MSTLKTVNVIQKKYLVNVYQQGLQVHSLDVDLPSKVRIVLVGTQGPQGAPGASGAGFVHTQVSPATEWIVNHNLGFRPVVEVINSGGIPDIADVVHMTVNQVRVYFAAPTAGEARCV